MLDEELWNDASCSGEPDTDDDQQTQLLRVDVQTLQWIDNNVKPAKINKK